MTHFRAIMDRNISELEVSVTYPLAPNPQDEQTIKEADFMLPENERPDYRISTTANNEDQDEFECDRCGNTFYQLVTYETQAKTQTYAKCLECGWRCPSTAAIAPPSDATDDEKSCLKCRHLHSVPSIYDYCEPEPYCHRWVYVPAALTELDTWYIDCPQHCGSFEAIASVGGVA